MKLKKILHYYYYYCKKSTHYEIIKIKTVMTKVKIMSRQLTNSRNDDSCYYNK